jgi:membrane protein DedA with SNARE-associated domain
VEEWPILDQVGSEDDGAPEPPARRRLNKRALSLIVAIIIILVIGGWVGDASAAYLVDHHTLWLIALNARNRNLVLVVNQVDALPYYVVGTVRLLLSDPLFYILGYFYGDAGIKWMERQAPTYGRMMRSAERWFGVAAYPLVFIAPNNYICLFAGAAGMSIPVFLILNVTGTVFRLWIIQVIGNVFDKPIDSIISFIQDYRVPILIASVVLVLFTIWNERRQGESEIEALAHLEEELEELEAEQPDD